MLTAAVWGKTCSIGHGWVKHSEEPFLLGILRDIWVFSLRLLLQHFLDPPYHLALNSEYIYSLTLACLPCFLVSRDLPSLAISSISGTIFLHSKPHPSLNWCQLFFWVPLCLRRVWRCSSSLLQASGPWSLREQHLLFLCTHILYYALNEITTSCLVPGAADPVDCVLPKDTDFVADTVSVPQYLVFPMYLLRISYLDTVCHLLPPFFSSSDVCALTLLLKFMASYSLIILVTHTYVHTHPPTPPLTLLCVYRFINTTQWDHFSVAKWCWEDLSSFSNQCLPVALILGLKPCENSLIHVGKWVDALISKSYLGNHTVEISWAHLLLCHRKIEGTVLYYMDWCCWGN